MNKNDIIKLSITAVSSEGSGIGRYENKAVFVPQTAIGDQINALILKDKKNLAFGKIEEILLPSADRIEPDCPSFKSCGGCVWRHINYEAESKIKENKVYEAMRRIGGIDMPPQPIIKAESTERYRNKAQFPLTSDGSVGFYANHSHRVIPAEDCALQPAVFSALAAALKKWVQQFRVSVYSEENKSGLLRHFYLRIAEATGEIMAVLVINGNSIPKSDVLIELLNDAAKGNLKSVMLNINTTDTNVILGKKNILLFGKEYIEDILCGVKVRVSPLSFYQVNRRMTERLYGKAQEYAKPQGKYILDLYCGAGTIGLSMAKNAAHIIGVEIIPDAVKDANINAEENGIENAEFICGDAAAAARDLRARHIKPDAVILDPPRKGCDSELLSTVAKDFAPERIVYVSCDPSTLARDAKILTELKYTLKEYTPVDLFPRTSHVETVAYFVRNMNIHNMKLHSSPFHMIKNGEKTIELRLLDEKRKQIKEGDKILFTNNKNGETLLKTVVKLHKFESFKELYKSLPLLKCGYTKEDIDTASPADMNAYYSDEEQLKYGVIGIELANN